MEPQPTDLQAFVEALRAFATAASPDERARALAEHPELLGDEFDAFLGEYMAFALREGRVDRWESLNRLRESLRSIRGGAAPGGAGGGDEVAGHLREEILRAGEHFRRFEQTDDPAALDEAVAAAERVLGSPGLAASAAPYRASLYNDCAAFHFRRYALAGRAEDLDRAVACLEQACAEAPPDSGLLAGMERSLLLAVEQRYHERGRPEDIDRAVQLARQALPRHPPGAPGHHEAVLGLARLLLLRQTGSAGSADVEEAVGKLARAVGVTAGEGDAEAAEAVHAGLGLALALWAERGADPAGLERNLGALEEAVGLAAPASPERRTRLMTLAQAGAACYARAHAPGFLDGAIEAVDRALDPAPSDPGEHAALLTDLALLLVERLRPGGPPGDPERAYRAYERHFERGLVPEGGEVPLHEVVPRSMPTASQPRSCTTRSSAYAPAAASAATNNSGAAATRPLSSSASSTPVTSPRMRTKRRRALPSSPATVVRSTPISRAIAACSRASTAVR